MLFATSDFVLQPPKSQRIMLRQRHHIPFKNPFQLMHPAKVRREIQSAVFFQANSTALVEDFCNKV